jgi:hypothetical protein
VGYVVSMKCGWNCLGIVYIGGLRYKSVELSVFAIKMLFFEIK